MKITVGTISRIIVRNITELGFFNKRKYVIYKNIE